MPHPKQKKSADKQGKDGPDGKNKRLVNSPLQRVNRDSQPLQKIQNGKDGRANAKRSGKNEN